MRALAGDDLAASWNLGHEADQVAHRAAGNEQAGLLAGQLCGALFKCNDSRIVPEDVIANFGVSHGAPHLWRGVGDGVGTQVDQSVGHSERRV